MISKKSRIALIGNMNNNQFAFLRYLHFLGFKNSRLFLFKNDNIGSNSHFSPEADTYNINKWNKYIIRTPFYDGKILHFLFRTKKTEIKNYFKDYDFFIGQGFAPALFYKANLKLDIFCPYAVGVEYIYKFDLKFPFLKSLHFNDLSSPLYFYYQYKGLKNNTGCAVTLDRDCIEVFNNLSLESYKLTFPTLYNKELNTNINDGLVNKFRDKIRKFKYVIYSHASHNYNDSYKKKIPKIHDVKKNYITIEAFAIFVKKNNINDAVLVLHDYGSDVDKSKELIIKLEIEKYVIWVPILYRKQLMQLLDLADIGVSEFGGIFWGAIGFEFAIKGVPFVHYLGMKKDFFLKKFGMPMPPIFDTKNKNEISEIFLKFYKNPSLLTPLKKEFIQWFDNNSGISVVKKIINLLNN